MRKLIWCAHNKYCISAENVYRKGFLEYQEAGQFKGIVFEGLEPCELEILMPGS